ncbi:MAG: hypothetical protein LBF37_00550 [Rickettsiales bacterium]|jgi:uncharacterized cysteine cluster protein YcgN (CxxCxxCC family)|nr:hypothetical protein [Rickettsiales bacterium]
MLDINQIKKNIDELNKLSPQAWDKICKNCGLCCLAKVEDDNQLYYSNYTCQHFDLKTRKCNCYRQRLTNSNCQKLTMKHIIDGKLIPDNCAYVEKIFGKAKYQTILDWSKIQNIDCTKDENIPKITSNIIPSSVFWSARYNFQNSVLPGITETKSLIRQYMSDINNLHQNNIKLIVT